MPRAERTRRASRPPPDTKRVVRPLRLNSAIPIDFMAARASVLRENALRVNSDLTVFEVSCLTGQGLDGWLDWIRERLAQKRMAAA